jgi:hypothetical protein
MLYSFLSQDIKVRHLSRALVSHNLRCHAVIKFAFLVCAYNASLMVRS